MAAKYFAGQVVDDSWAAAGEVYARLANVMGQCADNKLSDEKRRELVGVAKGLDAECVKCLTALRYWVDANDSPKCKPYRLRHNQKMGQTAIYPLECDWSNLLGIMLCERTLH